MHRRYAKPPVIEAVAEFRFANSAVPELAIPGLVYERLRAELPRHRSAVGFHLAGTQLGAATQGVVASQPRLQLLPNGTDSFVVQVAPHWLTVNHLSPYPGWAVFKPRVAHTLAAYIAAAQPTALQAIGLRYTNEIATEKVHRIETYLRVRPDWPEGFQLRGFFELSLQHQPEGAARVLETRIRNVPGDPPRLILDLHSVSEVPPSLEPESVSAWLEAAHADISEHFELCLTDELRERFGPEEDK